LGRTDLIIRATEFNPCGILGRTDLIIRATEFNPCGIWDAQI